MFIKPKLPEIVLWFMRAGVGSSRALSEGRRFFEHHESKGWRIGKQPMKKWEMACQTWLRNMRERDADRTRNISAPRRIEAVKTKSDDKVFRHEQDGRIYEFTKHKAPPAESALFLSYRNWLRDVEAKRA